MTPLTPTFLDAVDAIRATDRRYAREAYGFLIVALERTVGGLPAARKSDPTLRHVSGRELLEGVVELGRREFGALAPTVFREWGITSGDDVGAMVFALVEARTLTARPEDTMADFAGMPDLLARLGAEPGGEARRRVSGDRTGDPERSA